jgi:hypothetical protein
MGIGAWVDRPVPAAPALGRFHPGGLNPVVVYSGQRVVTVQHVFVISMNKNP